MVAILKSRVLEAYASEIKRLNLYDYSTPSFLRDNVRASMKSPYSLSFLDRYDVFLSHSHDDEKIAMGIKRILENKGKSVYIDYVNDAHTSVEKVTAQTANLLKQRMERCSEMIYVHSQNASISKWCPWELGYFDKKSARISIAFVDASSLSTVSQEYLQLYPQASL